MIFARYVLPLVALLGAPLPAQASQSPERVTAEGLAELHEYSRCVVFNRPTQARQVLAMDPETPRFNEALTGLIHRLNGCTHGRLAANQLLFVGSLAEQLLKRQGSLDLASATAHNPSRPALRARDEADYMAMCLVRAQPSKVADLFDARPGSAEEGAAVTAIQPHLAGCMTAGQSMRLNRAGLRAVLAWASFRLINHNSAPAAAAARD